LRDDGRPARLASPSPQKAQHPRPHTHDAEGSGFFIGPPYLSFQILQITSRNG